MANFLRSFATGFVRSANERFAEDRRLQIANDLAKSKRLNETFLPAFITNRAKESVLAKKEKDEAALRAQLGISPTEEANIQSGLGTAANALKFRQDLTPEQRARFDAGTFTSGQPAIQSIEQAASARGFSVKDLRKAGIDPNQFPEQVAVSPQFTGPGIDSGPRSLKGSQTALITQALQSIGSGDSDKFFATQANLAAFNAAIAQGNPQVALSFINPQRATIATEGNTTELQDQYFKIIKDVENPALKGQALEALRAGKFSEVAELISQDGEESGVEVEGAPFAVFLKNPVAVGNVILPRGQTTAFRTNRGTVVITVATPDGGIDRKEIPSAAVIPFSAQSPEAPGPTAAQTADFALEVDQQTRGSEIATQLAQLVDTGQLPGGVAGAIKGFAQTAVGSVRDIADLLAGDAPLTGLLVAQESEEAPEEILENDDPRFERASEKIKSDLNNLFAFNPEIPRAEVRASYIALLLAFSRFPRGRINVSIINQTASLSSPFRGSRADVVARLTEISKELKTRADFTGRQLQRSVPLETLTVPNIIVQLKNRQTRKITSDDIIETARATNKTVEQVLEDLQNPEFLKSQGLTIQ